MPAKTGTLDARALPERANLEHLKKQAKQRLQRLRAQQPSAQLADAQFQLAREYGFASWRELKAEVDRRAGQNAPDPVGDWIGVMAKAIRVAFHVRRIPSGALVATNENPDANMFDLVVDDCGFDGETLTFTLRNGDYNGYFEGAWDPAQQGFAGTLTSNGAPMPLTLSRGVWPPRPVLAGLDGLWDGLLVTDKGYRLIIQVRTDEHGTYGWVDSPDRGVSHAPLREITRDGDVVQIRMMTASVAGKLSADGSSLEGEFVRGEERTPLTLRRRAPGAPGLPDPNAPEAPLDPERLASFAGDYRLADELFSLSVEGGGMLTKGGGMPSLALYPISPNELAARASSVRVMFERNAKGEVIGLTLDKWGRRQRAPKLS